MDCDGRPGFAELAILWSLQEAGWQGAWVTHAVGREIYRIGLMDVAPVQALPRELATRLARIRATWGTSKGIWNVCCFREQSFLFAESKRRGRDSMKPQQAEWLEVALD